jgi:transcriptional regulator of acetoin/glycerol metabolism
MVRSQFIVVSDDQALIQKAQQFGQMHGVPVQVQSPEQHQATVTELPSLVAGHTAVGGTGAFTGTEGAKVLQFPGNQQSADTRRGVATINQLESVAIEQAIAAFKGNLTEAAKALGIGRATLYRKVKQYNIDPSMARKKKAA